VISVYCPTYNRAEILKDRALPSVLAQTYKNFEFIIMGDCCTDNTEDIVNSYHDPRVRYYNLESREGRKPPEYADWTAEEKAMYWWLMGPTWAANAALDLCRGEWIARIDDDDMWFPSHLEDLLLFAENGDYDFVSSAYERVEKSGITVIEQGDFGAGGTQTWLYKAEIGLRYNPDSWRKEWNKNNDIDFVQRIYEGGWKMGYLPEVTALIVPRPGDTEIGSKAYLSDSGKILDWIGE